MERNYFSEECVLDKHSVCYLTTERFAFSHTRQQHHNNNDIIYNVVNRESDMYVG